MQGKAGRLGTAGHGRGKQAGEAGRQAGKVERAWHAGRARQGRVKQVCRQSKAGRTRKARWGMSGQDRQGGRAG